MDYDLKSLRTIMNKDPKLGGLSFVEGQIDIPFAIKRIYCIYKTEDFTPIKEIGSFFFVRMVQ